MSGSPSAAVAAFSRHGTYIEDTPATIAQYGGSIDAVVTAMNQAQMTHAWVRIHGRKAYGPKTRAVITRFIAALKAGGIAVAGWGWCQGDDPRSDAAVALSETSRFGLSAYVADIEPDGTKWTVERIQQFFTALRAHFHGAVGVTSYPLIDWHEPNLLKASLPYVDMVNPQIYWFHFPNATMVAEYRKPDGSRYRADNAPDYTDLCLDRWNKLMGAVRKNIVVSGQAYWGESHSTQAEIEAKVREFLAGWNAYDAIVGYNWYSFGGETAMSTEMLRDITAARLGDKAYRA
jgi:hypothetical protein